MVCGGMGTVYLGHADVLGRPVAHDRPPDHLDDADVVPHYDE